jgi:hypothetical protein
MCMDPTPEQFWIEAIDRVSRTWLVAGPSHTRAPFAKLTCSLGTRQFVVTTAPITQTVVRCRVGMHRTCVRFAMPEAHIGFCMGH